MSHCRDFEEAWWEAAEGRPLSAEAEAHLRTCESCRATVRRLSAASTGFEALRTVAAPDPSAAVWQRVRRPVRRPARRPAFALAWTAGVVACVVAATFALQRVPTSRPEGPAQSTRQIAQGPQAPPTVKPNPPAPVAPPVAESTQPVKLATTGHGHEAGGRGRVAPPHHVTYTMKRYPKRQPEAPAQTQMVEAPSGAESTVVQVGADASCSETAALAYRAIGRALVTQLLSGKSETG